MFVYVCAPDQPEELLLPMTLLPSRTMGMSDFPRTLRRPANAAYSFPIRIHNPVKMQQTFGIYTHWYHTPLIDGKPGIYVDPFTPTRAVKAALVQLSAVLCWDVNSRLRLIQVGQMRGFEDGACHWKTDIYLHEHPNLDELV